MIKSWANGTEHRRVFVLEQAAEFLRSHGVGVGDAVGICTDENGAWACSEAEPLSSSRAAAAAAALNLLLLLVCAQCCAAAAPADAACCRRAGSVRVLMRGGAAGAHTREHAPHAAASC